MATPHQRKLFRHIRGRIELISRKVRLGETGNRNSYIPVTGPYAICLDRVPNTPDYYYTIIDQTRGIMYSRKGPIQTVHKAVCSAVVSCYALKYSHQAIPIIYFGLRTGRAGKEVERLYEQASV